MPGAPTAVGDVRRFLFGEFGRCSCSIVIGLLPGPRRRRDLDERRPAARLSGWWGGVLVLGHAPINTAAGLHAIEGVPPTVFRNVHGGNDPDDSSGTLRYVSIRHRGTIVRGARYFMCVTSYHPRNINRRDGNGAPVSRVRVVVCS